MHTITLNDGDSHALGATGMLKIEVFPVGGAAANLRLAVSGDGVRVTAPNNTLAIVTEVPESATISVSSPDGADFGIDQSVQVTVTRSGEATVQFPVVHIGGVPVKTLGSVVRTGDSLTLNAFGSSVAADVSRPVMAVSSALRTRLTGAPGLRRLHLVADTGATFHRVLTPDTLAAAVTVTQGIATVLGTDLIDISTSAGPLGQRSLAGLENLLAEAAEADRTRVGTTTLARNTDPETLTVHLTATPVRAMVSDTSHSLLLVVGPGASDEEQLYATSPVRTATTGVVPVTPEFAGPLAEGDATTFAPVADTIAGVLRADVHPAEVAR
ncbi:hypothetical protein [Corynebacterium terpenotabidum]|uniref:Uncharacterized protein n=1 Tax=Corynebacterium terpenotabidum Y-11 TaxID=1200352 RepID=S4XBD6_9CORY|nr:hypothetical protein [Corynebacterium terpenotabidum]AGP29779.1 hypothetical protein A606_00620 [Corynebacterium terpenotabidum Y-11]